MIVVAQFPGTTCGRETSAALEQLRPGRVRQLWHGDAELPAETRLVVLPGGFSFGDYLRAGALAARSPLIAAVQRHAVQGCQSRGGWVLGICNGFQILTEAKLLPGALQRNAGLDFVCDTVGLQVRGGPPGLLQDLPVGTALRLPIAHREGRYVADAATLEELTSNQRILLQYTDAGTAQGSDPNGSALGIAGICSANRRVLGMMPHPERAMFSWQGNRDGNRWLAGFLQAIDREDGSESAT